MYNRERTSEPEEGDSRVPRVWEETVMEKGIREASGSR
jgi:hypothetical protein